MKLNFENFEADSESKNPIYLAHKVTQAIASDLPEATWRPDVLTQDEVRYVVQNMLQYAIQADNDIIE